MSESNIHKLVSLTFDENPKVRREAAKSLSETDDPAALFALMELSYDKDTTVRKAARDLLNKKKSDEREVMSFAEIFSSKPSAIEELPQSENQEEKKRRILQPIDQLFEKKLGKQKADAVKGKMMPTIEKIYSKVINVKHPSSSSTGRQAIQEFLTSYLEAISDIDALGTHEPTKKEDVASAESVSAHQPQPQTTLIERDEDLLETHLSTQYTKEEANLHEELSAVGSAKPSENLQSVVRDIKDLEREEMSEEDHVSKLPPTFLKRAYETMMLTEGDEEMMKTEMRRMLRDVERDLKLAFAAAKKKYKETNITHLAKIKEGIGLVNTEVLTVKSVEDISFTDKKKEISFCRIVVNDDEGNEGVVYILDKKNEWLKPGMKIKVLRGRVKSSSHTGETAITVGKKGNVYIVL